MSMAPMSTACLFVTHLSTVTFAPSRGLFSSSSKSPLQLNCSTRRTVACSTTPDNHTPTKTYVPTPSHGRLPLLGFFWDLFRRGTESLKLRDRYGDVYHTDFLGTRLTKVTDLDAVNALLKNRSVTSEGAQLPALSKLFGERALFQLDGPPHTSARSTVNPAFVPSLFPSYFPVILNSCHRLWDNLSTSVQSSSQPVVADAPFKVHFLRIITTITNGSSLPKDPVEKDVELTRLRAHFVNMMSVLFSLPYSNKYCQALRDRDILLAETSALIIKRLTNDAEVIEQLRASNEFTPPSLLELLRTGDIDLLTILTATSGLPTSSTSVDAAGLEDLAYLILLIWFAGYATQGATIQSCVTELCLNADIWNKLKKEQDAIPTLNMETIQREMPLLDSFITECLRLFPPVPMLMREAKEGLEVCGHWVEPGTILGLDVWAAQTSGKYFDAPDELQMERFVGKKNSALPTLAAFGGIGSPHYCLGAGMARVNLKTTIAVLLRDFEIEIAPRKERKYTSFPEMKPEGGVRIVRLQRVKGRMCDDDDDARTKFEM